MSLSVRVAAYGDEVFGELSRALEVAQAGDPLRLVTVMVAAARSAWPCAGGRPRRRGSSTSAS